MTKKLALALLVCTSLHAPLSHADVLSYHGFEIEGKGEFKDFFLEGPQKDSISLSTDWARTGKHSVKMAWTRSDWSPNERQFAKRRVELTSKSPPWPEKMVPGKDWYVGLTTFLPSDFQIDYPENKECIWQFHGEEIAGGSPALSANIVGDQVSIETRTYDLEEGPSQITENGDTIKVLGTFPLDIGKATDWVIMVNWDIVNGHIKVWRNAKLVIDYVGPNLYATAQGQVITTKVLGQAETYQLSPAMMSKGTFFKFGDYKWDWGALPSKVTSRTIYADEIRIGDSNSSYNEVRPGQ